MDNFGFLAGRLEELKKTGLLRNLSCISSCQGSCVRFCGPDRSEKILFCSNNYLNLANHPAVVSAVCRAVQEYGFGACASRLISGTMLPHVQLEKAFAQFFHKEAALLLPSGWAGNQALIQTIPQRGDIVLLDKLNHASIIDAAAAGSARFHTYRRDNPAKLEKLLADNRYNHKFIVTESIFSMDGDCADLKTLAQLSRAYNACLIVDEAHSLGCLGRTGAGLAEQLGLMEDVDIIVAPLGKAVAATGCIVAGPQVIIDYLINRARPFIYTTAPSPVNCAAAMASLNIIKNEPQRRSRLASNAEYLRKKLNMLNLNTGNSTAHIVPVILGSAARTVRISRLLFEKGFYAAAIRPPTVPEGTARLRISVQADHTVEQINSLCRTIEEIIKSGE